MERKKIEELIRLVEDSEISELEISGPFNSVRIVKAPSGAAPQAPAAYVSATAAEPQAQSEEKPPESSEADDRDAGLVPIVSPMVGTFYASPSPDAQPYVRQGDHVSKGQVVCIVEAMKLINEIESEVSGTIVRVAVENAQPVEFGQVLFMVEPD